MLAKGWPLRDVDVFIDTYDRPNEPTPPDHPCYKPGPGPVLTGGKAPELWHGIAVPDWSFGGWWEVRGEWEAFLP
jgi:Glycosyl transferase family 90